MLLSYLMIQRSQEEGISVALRSRGDNLTNETGIYMVDTLGITHL